MNQWLQLTSGRGPEECCWVVFQLVKFILSEAKQESVRARLIEAVAGDRPNTYRSALIGLEGRAADGFRKRYDLRKDAKLVANAGGGTTRLSVGMRSERLKGCGFVPLG
jgi:hypothetical protein